MNTKVFTSFVVVIFVGFVAYVALICGMQGVWPWRHVHQDRDLITAIKMARHVSISSGSTALSANIIRFQDLDLSGKPSQSMIDLRSNLAVHNQIASSSKHQYAVEIVDSDEPRTNPHEYVYYPDTGELGRNHEWVYVSNAFRSDMKSWGAK